MPIIDGRYYSVFILTGFRIFNTYLMKTKTIEAHFCDHCNKLYQRKHAAIKHEERCYKNPVNHRPCFECKHLTYGKYGGKKLLFCTKKQHFLYTPQNEIKRNWKFLARAKNEPMPKVCALYLIEPSIDLFHKGIIDKEELNGFEQMCESRPEIAHELFNGFESREDFPFS